MDGWMDGWKADWPTRLGKITLAEILGWKLGNLGQLMVCGLLSIGFRMYLTDACPQNHSICKWLQVFASPVNGISLGLNWISNQCRTQIKLTI